MRKPSFISEVIRKKVCSLFPDVSAFAPIRGGEESQAFRFTSEDREFIFRLNSKREDFEKDRFAFERFARPDLPIPRVFQIGQFEDHFYCISQKLPGRTLEDLDPNDIWRLLAPTHEVWLAIANSDLGGISGYGRFDSKGTTTFSRWRDFLVEILDKAKYRWEGIRGYPTAQIMKEWRDAFYLLTAFCPEERALVHGDFGSNNVLADREHITGVVDWSEAMIGDPLYDVANFFFWRTWLPCMEQPARYFEAHPLNVPNWEERILCYQLRIGFSEVFANSLERRYKVVIWALGRCKEIVHAIRKQP